MVVPITRSWRSVCNQGLAQSSLSETSRVLLVRCRRWNELKDLVSLNCAVRELLSCRIDNIARVKVNRLRSYFCDRDIGRHGDRLRSVLVVDHECGTTALLDCSVRHA